MPVMLKNISEFLNFTVHKFVISIMKKFIPLIVLLFLFNSASAIHIKGGWIYYQYLGPGIKDSTKLLYNITLKVYRDCNIPNPGQNDDPMNLTVYSGNSAIQYTSLSIPLDRVDTMNKKYYNPCLTTDPPVCYHLLVYTINVELPASANGYTLSYQRCCRIAGIANVVAPSSDYGNTYSTSIPGTALDSTFPMNSSPVFAQKDTVLICYRSYFTLDYSAVDPDGDSLVYYYSNALNGGSTANPTPSPSSPPSAFTSIPYSGGYSATNPFGTNVNINSATGIISGYAPNTPGEYVLSVSVDEYRHGIKFNTTRKELHVIVGDCALSAAALKPSYLTCDGYTLTFQNESSASNIIGYHWDFGVKNSTTDTSSNPTPTYTYADTGVFNLKLVVDGVGGCSDSANSEVKVYPGFFPNFYAVGSCYTNPFQFYDSTRSKYGIVNNWWWNFGDSTNLNDTSVLKNPQYTYPSLGTRTVTFYVSDNKGCSDTVRKTVSVTDKPLLIIASKDTALCDNDSVKLVAQSEPGVTYSWTPLNNIIYPDSSSPFVYPKDTTYYYVDVTSNGCKNRDSVKVRVYKFITVNAGKDSSICLSDTIVLNPVTVATSFDWEPKAGIIGSNTVMSPTVSPSVATLYTISANLGRCPSKDSIWVIPYPYPKDSVGAGDSICYGKTAQLFATYTGKLYYWSPTSSLINPTSLTPTAGPATTTTYTFTTVNTSGCMKPVSKDVTVIVRNQITVNAGRDTMILLNQPLQLSPVVTPANDSLYYLWSPSVGLDSATKLNAIALLPSYIDSITYRLTATDHYGCYGQDDIKIVLFKTGPDILVPTAFTPNGDGLNDIFKPFTIGLTRLDYFSVYNRWGQLLYKTTILGQGWDGNFNGKAQPSGTYVYQAQGTDFTGKSIYRKGTFVLIR